MSIKGFVNNTKSTSSQFNRIYKSLIYIVFFALWWCILFKSNSRKKTKSFNTLYYYYLASLLALMTSNLWKRSLTSISGCLVSIKSWQCWIWLVWLVTSKSSSICCLDKIDSWFDPDCTISSSSLLVAVVKGSSSSSSSWFSTWSFGRVSILFTTSFWINNAKGETMLSTVVVVAEAAAILALAVNIYEKKYKYKNLTKKFHLLVNLKR